MYRVASIGNKLNLVRAQKEKGFKQHTCAVIAAKVDQGWF